MQKLLICSIRSFSLFLLSFMLYAYDEKVDLKKNNLYKKFIYISADYAEFENKIANFYGDVILKKGNISIASDQAKFDTIENISNFIGNLKIKTESFLILGNRSTMKIDDLQIENPQYFILNTQARGSALYASNKNGILELQQGTYTSCPSWMLQSNKIKLNNKQGVGIAKHTYFLIKNIPVFYIPYISFPIDNRRKSGFLPPKIFFYSNNFAVVTPYYFNLASHYDATFSPRYIKKIGGILLEGEFRYLKKNKESNLNLSYLLNNNNKNKRWGFSFKSIYKLSDNVQFKIDYTTLSDKYYLKDFHTDIPRYNKHYVNQQFLLLYKRNNLNLNFNVQSYQLAQPSKTIPYNKIPQITFDWWKIYNNFKLNVSTEYVRFNSHFKHFNNTTRFHIEPSLSFQFHRPWGYIIPKLSFFYTKYEIPGGQPNFTPRIQRNLYSISLDSVLSLSRNKYYSSNRYNQTVSLRAMYIYIPYKNQANIPIFDTHENDFNYHTLWRENIFYGKDRIGDTNKISFGFTTKLFEKNGFERATFSAGTSYVINTSRVQFPYMKYKNFHFNNPILNIKHYPYSFTWLYRVNTDFSITSELNVHPNNRSGNILFHYKLFKNTLFNIGYRYRRDIHNNIIKQHDVSSIFPLSPKWTAFARWQYDYHNNRNIELLIGLEYQSCCFKLRLLSRSWLKRKYNDEFTKYKLTPDHGVFIQILIKGIGDVTGRTVENFISNEIKGYRSEMF